MVDQIARWIDRVRAWSSESETGLDPAEVSTRLGIVDGGLARALCDESVGERSTEEAAAALWANVQAWPGSTWTRSGDRL